MRFQPTVEESFKYVIYESDFGYTKEAWYDHCSIEVQSIQQSDRHEQEQRSHCRRKSFELEPGLGYIGACCKESEGNSNSQCLWTESRSRKARRELFTFPNFQILFKPDELIRFEFAVLVRDCKVSSKWTLNCWNNDRHSRKELLPLLCKYF